MIVVFFTAISGGFLSFQFGPLWAAWIFFRVAIIFNPWRHQYHGESLEYDAAHFIWFIIRGGVILWMCLAGFIVYPNTNKREGFWNKYPLVIPAGISIVLLCLLHLSRYINTEGLGPDFRDSSYIVVRTVVLSAALYGTVLSFMLGLKWIAAVFCLMVVFLISLSYHDFSYSEEGFAVLWLCLSSFLARLDNKTIQPVLWKKEASLLWYQPLTISIIWSIGWLISQMLSEPYTYVRNAYIHIVLADLVVVFIILLVVMILFGLLVGLVLKRTITTIQRNQKIAIAIAWVIAIIIGEIIISFGGNSFFTNFTNSICVGSVVVLLITRSVL